MPYLSAEAIQWALQTLPMEDTFTRANGKSYADRLLSFIYTKLTGISPIKKFYVKNTDGDNLKHWMNLVYTSGPEEHKDFAEQPGFSYFNPLLRNPTGSQQAASCGKFLRTRLQSNVQVQQNPFFTAGTDNEGKEWVLLDYPNYITSAKDYLDGHKISILALSIWYNKFFEVDEQITPSMLVDDFSKVLNVEKIELSEIFSDDVTQFPEIPLTSQNRSSPSEIREFINWNFDETSQTQKESLDLWLTENRHLDEGDSHSIYAEDYLYKDYMSFTEANLISRDDFIELLENRHQIILYGPPGTSKTYLALKYLSGFTQEERIKLHTFHQSTTYEEFVGGYTFGPEGDPEFKNGYLWDSIDAANNDPENQHVLLIDEINRGNISKILGECFTALDRAGNYNVLVNKIEGEERIPSKKVISIPNNLYIIGTMNTSDLSLTKIDDALRRRFAFVKMLPSSLTLRGLTNDSELENGIVTKFFDFINIKIEDYLGSSGQKIGHAIFMPKNLLEERIFVWRNWSQLRLFFNYTLHPLIESKSLGRPEIMYNILQELNQIFDDDSSFEKAILRILYNRGHDDDEED